MAETRHVRPVRRERDEIGDASLADQQDRVPSFAHRADQEGTALALKDHLSTARAQERERVLHVEPVSLLAADRRLRGKLGEGGVVRDLPEPEQVQHDDAAFNPAQHQSSAGFLGRLEVHRRRSRFGHESPPIRKGKTLERARSRGSDGAGSSISKAPHSMSYEFYRMVHCAEREASPCSRSLWECLLPTRSRHVDRSDT